MIPKIQIGSGDLVAFKIAYEKVATLNKGKMWSQLFPAGTIAGSSETRNNYEFLIGYEEFAPVTAPAQPVAPAKPAFQADL